MPWYLAWQNSWLHYTDKRFWSLHDHALSSTSSVVEKIDLMSYVKHQFVPYMIAIARMLSAPRFMFGICAVGGAPHARPGLPLQCGAPQTRVVCAYLFQQKRCQAATRRATFPRPQRLVSFVSLSTSRVLQIWFVYHDDFLPQRGTRWREDKTDWH